MSWPTKVALTIYQGSTYEHQFQLTSGGAPFDLTGYTARMQIRATVDSATTLYSTDSVTGDITITAASGYVDLEIHGDTSSAWDFTKGVYDIEIVSPTDKPYRIAEGSVKIVPEVTR